MILFALYNTLFDLKYYLLYDRLSKFESRLVVGFHPLVDATQGVFTITKQPLADISVPEGGCVSGNEAIRYAGFITFT